MIKVDAKYVLIRWILILHVFDIEIINKKGSENLVADHLSMLEGPSLDNFDEEINDYFPYERILMMCLFESVIPWYFDFANYLVGKQLPKGATTQEKRKFFSDLRHYIWDNPYLL
ncbi:unnamed protein product [Linum trigynum]|uniref:Reverse transcriptase RNase H-like domain-containing protein n=1 Tax=Linum trigynum TaxID=586398 RepID=A0AAV2EX69_9ROSI